jgi:hypothetical protein
VYFGLTIAFGSFLSGLVVGFLVRKRARGARLGFSSSILATLLFLTLFSLYYLNFYFLGWIFLFLGVGLIFDVIALVGGLIGASMKIKSMKLAVSVVLLAFALIPVHAFIFGPTLHIGSLVIEGNQILTIEDCTFHVTGNILVKDNATLVLRNVEFFIHHSGKNLQEANKIRLKNKARMIVENSPFTVITHSRWPWISRVYVEDSASLLLNKSSSFSSKIISRQNGNITMITSQWHSVAEIYDFSHFFVVDSFIYMISSYDSTNISCEKSIVNQYRTFNNSRLFLKDCNKSGTYSHLLNIQYGIIHARHHSYVKLENSTILGYKTSADRTSPSQNEVCFDNATINNWISISDSSYVYFHGKVTLKASFEFEELARQGQLVRNYTIITNPNFHLNVTSKELDSLLWKGQSNNYGYATFNITFTPLNFTHTLLLNNEKNFNVTSSTPLGIN